jgi:hypothetical protein
VVEGADGSYKVPLVLRDDGAHAEGRVRWLSAGAHVIRVTLGSAPVAGSPLTVRVQPAAVDPAQCFVVNVPATLTCGEPHSLELQVRDAFGNTAQLHPDRVTVACVPTDALDVVGVRGGGHAQPTLSHADNDTAAAAAVMLQLLPRRAGPCKLELCVDGTPVAAAPLPLTLAPGGLCLSACTLRGAGARRCVAGAPTTLVLQVRHTIWEAWGEIWPALLSTTADATPRLPLVAAHRRAT